MSISGSNNKDELQFEDKCIACVECGDEFEFSAGEQQYFTAKGLSEPKRCPACRKWRKTTLQWQKERQQ